MSASYVLVVNAGSSSLKYSLVDGETGDVPATGSVERIGESTGRLKHATSSGEHTEELPFPTFEDALGAAVDAFEDYGPSQGEFEVVAVGHRVVHGGERFSAPTLVDDEWSPPSRTCRRSHRSTTRPTSRASGWHASCFPACRTSLSSTPRSTRRSRRWRTRTRCHRFCRCHRIRRYGFHGTSHPTSPASRRLLGRPVEQQPDRAAPGQRRVRPAVRGGGLGRHVHGPHTAGGTGDGTRSGDLDPAVHMHLPLARLVARGHRPCPQPPVGAKGLCGQQRPPRGDALGGQRGPGRGPGLDVYNYRIRKYIGAYYAVLGHVDAVVFIAGVGERSPEVRAAVLGGLSRLGIELYPARNRSLTGPIRYPPRTPRSPSSSYPPTRSTRSPARR